MDWEDDFVAFVDSRYGDLYRFAWFLTGGAAPAAADLVQEILCRLYPQWDKVLAAASPQAYVRKAAVHRYLSQRRRLSSREISVGLRLHMAVAGAPSKIRWSRGRSSPDLSQRCRPVSASRSRCGIATTWTNGQPHR